MIDEPATGSLEPIDLAAIREGRIDLIGELAETYSGGCQHSGHIVDTKLRRVTCRECGEVLDPIEVICEYVRYWRRTKAQLERLHKLHQEERKREEERNLTHKARQVARSGGIWACAIEGRYEYWQDGRYKGW